MRKFKIFFVALVLIFSSNCVWAVGELPGNNVMTVTTSNENAVCYTSSSEVSINSEFYLILNLSKIDYSKFSVQIISTSNTAITEIPEGVSNVTSSGVTTNFTVNKDEVGLEKLGVCYTAPAQEGSIVFTIKITSLDDNLSTRKKEITTLTEEITTLNTQLTEANNKLEKVNQEAEENNEEVGNSENEVTEEVQEEEVDYLSEIEELEENIEKLENSIKSKESKKTELEEKINTYTEETMKQTASISVVEKTSDDEKMQDDDKKKLGQEDDKTLNMIDKMKLQMSELETDLQKANNEISSLTTTATYQGSQNNYLKSLTLTGVEFTSSFKKTTQNYFATVGESVNSVTVNATAEDSSAIVTVYGNKDLKSGKNKILVTVTADDGSVRTYKIYVTK